MSRSTPSPVARLTWAQALAWRLHRHHLEPVDGAAAVDVVRRLCGVQAQVPSAAAQAVAVRQARPAPDEAAEALDERHLIRTWAMRGTLHLLPADQAPAWLALLAAARTWEKGAWQRAFLTVERMAALEDAVVAALSGGRVLTREELVEAVATGTGDAAVAEQARSGWGGVLKPLAWRGLLCQGPGRGNRVTFTAPETWMPDWPGLPDPDEAARIAVPAYLAAFGPATPETFDQWLLRGATPRATLRRWFADLGDAIVPVDVEGTTAWARAEDVQDMVAREPSEEVRLLPAFDQYVLGPGTSDPQVVPAGHRPDVSRAGGWIAPVVVHRGRVAGTWRADDGTIVTELFPDAGGPDVPPAALRAEVDRVRAVLQ